MTHKPNIIVKTQSEKNAFAGLLKELKYEAIYWLAPYGSFGKLPLMITLGQASASFSYWLLAFKKDIRKVA